MSRISVAFACNDPRNGMPCGRVCSAHVSIDNDVVLELDAPDMTGPRFDWEYPKGHHAGGRAKVGRRRFPIIGHHGTWTGNWCWDAAAVDEATARALVAYLLERGFQLVAECETASHLLPAGASWFAAAAHGGTDGE